MSCEQGIDAYGAADLCARVLRVPELDQLAAEEALNGAIVASPSVVAGASPAKPGDMVSLFGTGFGDTNPSFLAGALATGKPLDPADHGQDRRMTLASSDVLYAGLSPGSSAASINSMYEFRSYSPTGDIPVTITIGGVGTQAGATIPVQ